MVPDAPTANALLPVFVHTPESDSVVPLSIGDQILPS
jgi:hypothetical protein